MKRVDAMREVLEKTFAPTSLIIKDDSAKHTGHAGARPEGETHFSIEIVSAKFAGVSRVESHRMINNALKPFFAEGLHALAITAKAPEHS